MLPVLIAGRASVTELVVAGLAVIVGAVAWAAARSGRLDPSGRRRTASALAAAALIGFGVVLHRDAGERPEAYLLLGSALAVSAAALPVRWFRVTLQGGVVVVVVTSLVAAGRSLPDVVFAGALVVATASLAGAFVRRMRMTRRAALRAGAEARNLAELLDAVRTLPGSSVLDAVEVVGRTLRSLGFDGAAVMRVRDGELEALDPARATTGPAARRVAPLRPDHELGWSAIDGDRTVVRRDGAHAVRPGRDGVPAPATGPVFAVDIATPVRVDGRPVAVVVGCWDGPHVPTAEEIEILEVLASHLGGVFAAQERIGRQAELLERMGALDRMRRELLGAVSDEVRDPLTIIRGAGQILASHAGRVGTEQRLALLGRMCTQAADLRELVDVLLDFSRSQARRADPTVGPTDLVALLRWVSEQTGASIVPALDELDASGLTVEADASLVRSALELLLMLRAPTAEAGATGSVAVESGPWDVTLRVSSVGESPASLLMVSLAGQLLEAGGGVLQVADAASIRLRRVDVTAAPAQGASWPARDVARS